LLFLVSALIPLTKLAIRQFLLNIFDLTDLLLLISFNEEEEGGGGFA